jgi:quinol monooxygenase YgiN
MLIVAGEFEVEPGRRAEFLRGREEAMRISRGEPGCHEYVLGADPIVPGRVVLYERWEDREALAAHLAANQRRREAEKARGDADPAVPVLSSEILQYEISAVGSLGS